MLSTPVYGSRASRLLGQMLDGIVAFVPLVLLVVLDTVVRGDAGSAADDGLGVIGVLAVVSVMAYILLADAMPGGQSIGKRWLGLAVVDARSGAPCSIGQSLARNLCLAALGPIDWLFIFGGRHQRLGDKLAGTIVVNQVAASTRQSTGVHVARDADGVHRR